MNVLLKRLSGVSLVLLLAALPAISEAQRHGGGNWHGGGRGWGPGWGISLGIGVPLFYGAPYDYYYGYPRTVVVAPPVVVAPADAAPVQPSSTMPEPVIYPRNGQSVEQTEADMRACNAWATTQAKALADASVFHRATAACMDGRGYSLR